MTALNQLRLKMNTLAFSEALVRIKNYFSIKRNRRKFLIISLAFLIPVGIFVTLRSSKVKADWYDDSYNQRQEVTFNHNADISSERRITLTINTSTLISDGKMQTDCDDAYFTSIGGKVLKYTLVSGCNTSSTVFDVVVDSVTDGGNGFFMYYSNPIAHSNIDGTVSSVTGLTPSGGVASAGSEEVGPSPSMFLKFDEGYGSTAYDSTSNGNNASLGYSTSVPSQVVRQEVNIIDHIASAAGDDPSLVQIDTTKYSGTVSFYFEVVGKVSSGTLTVALERAGTSTQDSTVTVTETSFTRKRSASTFSPPAGTTEYNINLSGGTSPEVKSARIVIIQNIGTSSLSATSTQIELGNYELSKSNPSSAPLSYPKYWKYTGANWDGTATYSAEVTYGVTYGTAASSVTYTTAGTGNWSCPALASNIVVETWGGGGAGGGDTSSNNIGGSGGGGGAYASSTLSLSCPNPYVYVVGAAGAGSTGAGTSGGYSTFDSTSVRAQGGRGGGANGGAGGAGGAAGSSTGDVVYSGGNGYTAPSNPGGGGGGSAGTGSSGNSASSQTGASAVTGGGPGGNGGNDAVNGSAPASGYGGGGGGAGDRSSSNRSGGAGYRGQVKISYTAAYSSDALTLILQEDNGSFGSWAAKATIVNAATEVTATTRTRVSFTPTEGRHYRIVGYIGNARSKYHIYNAKIVVEQTGTITKTESRYLLANTLLASGTAPQDFDTLFDPGEMSTTGSSVYYHEAMGGASSTSSIKLQQDPNGTPVDISNSTLTPSNRAVTTAISAPSTSQTIDVRAVTNNNDIYGSAIFVALTLGTGGAGSSAPGPNWVDSDDFCMSHSCVNFDGSSQRLSVADDESINFGKKLNNGFTVQAWIRPASAGESSTGRIFTKGTNNYLGLAAGSTGKVADLTASLALSGTNATLTVDDAITLNSWHLVTMTYTNDADDEISLYVDGVKVGESTIGSGSPPTATDVLYVGSDTDVSHFNGYIDEFKIYAKERTLAEINSDFIKYSPTMHGTSAAFGNSTNNFLSEGLVGYWKFDEVSSPSADFSGNGNSASWTSSPTYRKGKYDKAISLNGSTQYLSRAGFSNSLGITGDVTISAWVYRDTAVLGDAIVAYTGIGSSENVNNLYGFIINSSDNLVLKWEYGTSSAVTVASSSIVTTASGSWVYYSVTRNTVTKEVKFYENGIQLGTTQTYDQNPTGGTSSIFFVGVDFSGTTDYFDGNIDELRVYNRELTPEEILVLYETSPSNSLYYKFEENSGTSAYDSSGNLQTGTLTEGAGWAPGRYGSAVKFDGENEFVATSSTSYITASSSLTISGWVLMEDGFSSSAPANMGIVDKGDYKFYLDKTDGKAKWVVNDNVAKAFSALGSGTVGTGGIVYTLAVYNDNLYIGGNFSTAGTTTVNNVAKYNDITNSFSALGSGTVGTSDTVNALTVYNGNLYLAGDFTTAGGTTVNRIARYNDTTNTFSTVGSGTAGLGAGADILAVYNGNLYVGGRFTATAGGTTVNYIAKYNSTSNAFSAIGGSTVGVGSGTFVYGLAVYNGNLYLGGDFVTAGGVTVNQIAKYNDVSNTFSAIGGGTVGTSGVVNTISVYNNNLYVGGQFSDAGGTTVNYIAKYNDGTNTFSTIGGATPGTGSNVTIMAVLNNDLYVGGDFTTAGGSPINYVAKYNDVTNAFSDISGTSGSVMALAVYNNNLYVGGNFQYANSIEMWRVTKYGTSNLKTVASTSSSWTANKWYHFAGTFDNTNLKIYVNGVLENTTTNGSAYAISATSAPMLLGKTYGASWNGGSGEVLKGRIDEFKVYNYTAEVKTITKDLDAEYPAPLTNLGAPIAFWRFDESGGSTVYDRTGNSRNLTVVASPPTAVAYTVSGKYNKAFYPNAATYAYVDDNSFIFNSEGFAINMWVRSTSASNPASAEYVLGRGGNTTAGYGLYFATSGSLVFGIDDDTSWGPDTAVSSPSDIYDGLWHNVTAVKKSNTQVDLYVDGLLAATQSSISASGTVNGDNTLVIGARGEDYTAKFNGSIDEVSIYNYSVGSSEAKILFNDSKTSQWGVLSTDSSGSGPSNSYDREYCVPGDTSTCRAPVWHLRMDENTGTVLYDSSTCNVGASAPSGGAAYTPTWAPGKLGSAMLFDGDNDSMVGRNSICRQPTGNMTLEAWIYPTLAASSAGEDLQIISEVIGGASPYNTWSMWIASGSPADGLVFLWSSSSPANYYIAQSYNSTGVKILPNVWQHVVGVRSNGSLKVYINGLDVTEYSESPGVSAAIYQTTANSLKIGGDGSSNNFKGIIDDIKVYDYARSIEQINWEINRGDALYNYKFNECSGNTAYNSGRNFNGLAQGVNLTIYPQSSGNVDVGTCTGSANEMWYSGANGKFNGSLDFDGTDDYVASSNSLILTSRSGASYESISFGAWVYPDSSPTSKTIIQKNNEFRLTTDSSGIPQCSVYSGGWLTQAGSTALVPGTWSHVFCTVNKAGGISTYVNGVVQGSGGEGGTITSTNATALNIGRDSGGTGYFDGKIDEVTIHNMALTPALVKILYNENSALRFGD